MTEQEIINILVVAGWVVISTIGTGFIAHYNAKKSRRFYLIARKNDLLFDLGEKMHNTCRERAIVTRKNNGKFACYSGGLSACMKICGRSIKKPSLATLAASTISSSLI